MTTSTPKKKVKPTSRANHPAASKQRLYAPAAKAQAQAQAQAAVQAMTPAPTLRVVDPSGPKPPPNALQRLEVLERQCVELRTRLDAALERITQLEAQLDRVVDLGDMPIGADSGADEPEASSEPSVDATAEDLGGESA